MRVPVCVCLCACVCLCLCLCVCCVVIVVLMKGPYLYKQPVWTNLQASSLYIWKQGLALVLVLLMVAEFVDALMNAKYDYQKTAPAIQLIGLVAAYVLLMVCSPPRGVY